MSFRYLMGSAKPWSKWPTFSWQAIPGRVLCTPWKDGQLSSSWPTTWSCGKPTRLYRHSSWRRRPSSYTSQTGAGYRGDQALDRRCQIRKSVTYRAEYDPWGSRSTCFRQRFKFLITLSLPIDFFLMNFPAISWYAAIVCALPVRRVRWSLESYLHRTWIVPYQIQG